MIYVRAGDTEPIEVLALQSDGTALTGSTNLRVDIRRDSDGKFLDFADLTFKTSGWTTRQATLTEVSSSLAPGAYRTTVDTTGWAAGDYVVTAREVTTSLAANMPAGDTFRVGGSIANISSRLPTALVGGRIDASVGAVQSGAITASGFGAGAITSTVLADDAITAAKIAASAITSSEAPALANLDVAVSTRLAAGSYTAPPSATTIAGAVLDEAVGSHTTIGSAGAALGRVDVAVSTRATPGDVPSAAANASALLDASLSGHGSAGTAGAALAHLDADVSSRLAAGSYSAPPSAASIASQVWSTALPGAFSSGTGGFLVGTYLDATVSSRLATSGYSAPPSASTIASQVLGTAVPGVFASGTLGFVVGTNLDVVLSTRLASSSYSAPPSAGTIAAQVDTTLSGTHGSGSWATAVGFAVAGDAMTLTNGERGAVADAVWDEPTSGHATAGTAGAVLFALTAPPSASAIASQVWATAEGTPSAGTFGYDLKLLRMGLTNRLEESAGSPGLVKLYADDGTTLLKTWQVRDASGGAVTARAGSPAKRGAAT